MELTLVYYTKPKKNQIKPNQSKKINYKSMLWFIIYNIFYKY
jgi:hypothetical protein